MKKEKERGRKKKKERKIKKKCFSCLNKISKSLWIDLMLWKYLQLFSFQNRSKCWEFEKRKKWRKKGRMNKRRKKECVNERHNNREKNF